MTEWPLQKSAARGKICWFAAMACAVAALLAAPATARDSLGIFDDWGAFLDPAVPRCYAIAAAQPANVRAELTPFASVGTWPRRNVRGQFHIRLSRRQAEAAPVNLRIGTQDFALQGTDGDVWAANAAMDAAIVAAMRSARQMTVSSRDRSGTRFTDRYSVAGAATAMDAATVACARLR